MDYYQNKLTPSGLCVCVCVMRSRDVCCVYLSRRRRSPLQIRWCWQTLWRKCSRPGRAYLLQKQNYKHKLFKPTPLLFVSFAQSVGHFLHLSLGNWAFQGNGSSNPALGDTLVLVELQVCTVSRWISRTETAAEIMTVRYNTTHYNP